MRPPQHQLLTALPRPVDAQAVRFDRPLLVTEVALADGGMLTVVNLHLRAPLAANVPGQKIEPLVWKTVGGWAEGFFLSAIRRAGQALELRLLLEQLFDRDPHSLIAVAGDFNAEDRETPLRLAIGAEEDTGNGAISARSRHARFSDFVRPPAATLDYLRQSVRGRAPRSPWAQSGRRARDPRPCSACWSPSRSPAS